MVKAVQSLSGGIRLRDSVKVVVGALPGEVITLDPVGPTISKGGSRRFAAKGILTDGTVMTPVVQWNATGGTVDTGGVYTAGITTGTFQLAATLDGSLTGATPVTVVSAVLTQPVLSVPAGTSVAGGTGITTKLVATVTGSNIAGVMFGIASGPGISSPQDLTPEVTAASGPGQYEMNWSLNPLWTPAGGYTLYARVRAATGETLTSAPVAIQVTQGGTTSLPTITFAASPATITSGQSATLTWTSSNATSCSGSGGWSGTKTTAGSQAVAPTATTTYTLTCTGSGGSASKSATVTVGATTAVSVSVSSTSVQPGASVKVTFAGGAKADDWIGLFVPTASVDSDLDNRYLNGLKTTQPTTVIASGSFDFPMPTTPGSYELRFMRDDIAGCCTRTALAKSPLITVLAAPLVTFSAAPATFTAGQSVTLTWTSSNATSCSASGGWSGAKALSGSLAVSPTANTTYTLACTGASGTATRSATVTLATAGTIVGGVAIPQLALWQSNMLTYGAKHCAYIAAHKNDADFSAALAATYYDGTQVYEQIAQYTGNSSWRTCAQDMEYVYRDRYVIPNNAVVAGGYWVFSSGMRLNFERTGDPVAKQWAIALSTNSIYARDRTAEDIVNLSDLNYSREIAYALRSYIDAERLGAPRRSQRAVWVDVAYGQMAQFINKSSWGGRQVSPFMMGLTTYILIKDWEQTHDARLIPALRQMADFLWANAWVASAQGMKYNLNPNAPPSDVSMTPSPDLNNLIAPMYGFLYQQTGVTAYRDEGDALFVGAATNAYLDGSKQFNQNYQFAFDFVKWRQ
jgi:hypothetical protein